MKFALVQVVRYHYDSQYPRHMAYSMHRVSNTNDNKFQRYRANQHGRGLRLLRVWVPDPHAPGFRAEARKQAARLRNAPEETEALDFIENTADTRE